MSLQLSPQAAANELLKRRLARTNLHDFIKYINPEYITSDFSRNVCAELMQFLADVEAGLRPVLIFSAPPQHGKSEIVSRCLPAFIHGRNSELSIAGASYSADIAQDMGRDVQKIMGGDEYRRLFPAATLGETRKGVANKQNQTAYEIGNKGMYRGVGVGGGLTGRRVDIGIIDDPIKNSQEALSEVIKQRIWNWYITTFLTRLSKNSGHIIMATRWALDDLSGRVIENDNNVKLLSFPAINSNGSALVPELHPIDKLEKMRSTMSAFFWSAIYQQNPIPEGGLFFNEADFLVDGLAVDYPTSSDSIICVLDTAVKDGKQHDATAVIFCAYVRYPEPRLIILDWEVIQIRSSTLSDWLPSQISHAEQLVKQCKARHGATVWIEDKASGSTLLQSCEDKGIMVNAIPNEFVSIGKTERAVMASPYVLNQQIKFSTHAYDKQMVLKDSLKNHLLHQITQFKIGITGGSAADDAFDTAMYSILLALHHT
jgi:hypothetical protein